ncbi:MAG TPA: hypothetical protein VMM80_13155, partial [Bacteroidota bacterium]|nr:hypothetical protein [Bacteroidota bacterium]
VERILSWDRVAPLDLAALPLPVIAPPAISAGLARAVPDLVLLFGCCAASLGLGILRVRHYPLH